MLSLTRVSKHFSGLAALSEVSFTMREGSIKGLIGPNGAGKTTLFNTITGVYRPTSGSITLSGRDITGLKEEIIACLGVSRTFQQAKVFYSLTALENVLLGRHYRSRSGFMACGFGLHSSRREEREMREKAMHYLAFMGLAKRWDRVAHELPIGEQRWLEVARALATEPSLLLLDEPTAGLNERETEDFKKIVFGIRDSGVTILVIEHHMKFIMEVCDEIAVLNFGVKIAEGPPGEIQHSPEVIAAYLGAEEDDD
jgi:branched-chain amino acid transport system ATP-binding protein